jgi:hypothetical protein
MRALWPFLTFICGIMVLAGLFLPWISVSLGVSSSMYSEHSSYYDNVDTDFSGWDYIRCHTDNSYYGSESSGGCDNSSEWLVLVGAILMIVSAIVAFSAYQNERKLAAGLSSGAVFVGALLAAIGTLTYISDMNKLKSAYSTMGMGDFASLGINLTSTGVILSTVFAFFGMLCAVITVYQARVRVVMIEKSDGGYRSPDMGNIPVGASASTREYYEKKAASFGTETAPVGEEMSAAAIPTMPAIPSMPAASTPLPPLPPTIDDAAAQECFARAGELETAGDRDKSIEQYTKAIRLNSRYTTAYFKRGILLMGMGFKPAAVADFRRVIDIADNPELIDIAKANIAKLG